MQKESLRMDAVPGAHKGTTILRLTGNITLSTCFDLQDFLRQDASEQLILDMTAVAFVDSSGIGCLVNGYVARHMSGGRLVLAGANKRVLDTLAETRVNQFFYLFSSVDEAQQATPALAKN